MLNRTNGGEGVSGLIMSVEAKEKLSDYAKSRVHSMETKKRMSKSHTGKSSPIKGRKQTEDHRKKNSEKHTGSNNHNAKSYTITSQAGKIYLITGKLEEFCKEHNVNRRGIIDVAKKKKLSHKGWIAEYAPRP